MRCCFKTAAASVEGFTLNPEAPIGTGLTRGRLVVLEGIDGCGKTTQLQALRQWLPSSGLMAPGARLVVSREPGGTALGQALRELLLHPP